jgi:dynein heavy chain 2
VCRQQKLQFRPSIEEVRAKYYREMKKFLTIPTKFKGVSDIAPEHNIFMAMSERNAHRFDGLYDKAEQLFEKLSKVENDFEVGIINFANVHTNVGMGDTWSSGHGETD